jgi:PPM family protein phosphatase
MMRIDGAFAETDVGRKRRHNEDSYVSSPPVFVVADGMGGAQAGEVASALAAGTVDEIDHDPGEDGLAQVIALIKAANLRVHERATADASASGMGTTMTVAMLQPDGKVAIGHVGDSRAYRLREGRLEQLTDDHSLVAELVRRGELSPEEAAVHPQRSVITRALGTEPDVDAFTVDTQDGDLFLLCSDGLSTMLDPETIARILARNHGHLEAAAHALIKAANDRGGDDNITAILFLVADGDSETAAVPLIPLMADPADEDTLHPEDNVRLPALDEIPPAEVTMVVSAAEISRALEAQDEPTLENAAAWPAAASAQPEPAAAAPAEPDSSEPEGESERHASTLRLAIGVLVIVALSAAIVLLVLDALPR